MHFLPLHYLFLVIQWFMGASLYWTNVLEGFKDTNAPMFLFFFKTWILTEDLKLTCLIFLFFIPVIILCPWWLIFKKMNHFQGFSEGQNLCGTCSIPSGFKITFFVMESIFFQIHWEIFKIWGNAISNPLYFNQI